MKVKLSTFLTQLALGISFALRGGRTMGLQLQNGLFCPLHFLLTDVYVPKRREKNQEN